MPLIAGYITARVYVKKFIDPFSSLNILLTKQSIYLNIHQFNPNNSDMYVYRFSEKIEGYFMKSPSCEDYIHNTIDYDNFIQKDSSHVSLDNNWMTERICKNENFSKYIHIVCQIKKRKENVDNQHWYAFDYTAAIYNNEIYYYCYNNLEKIVDTFPYRRRLGKTEYITLTRYGQNGKSIRICLKRWCRSHQKNIKNYIFPDIILKIV